MGFWFCLWYRRARVLCRLLPDCRWVCGVDMDNILSGESPGVHPYAPGGAGSVDSRRKRKKPAVKPGSSIPDESGFLFRTNLPPVYKCLECRLKDDEERRSDVVLWGRRAHREFDFSGRALAAAAGCRLFWDRCRVGGSGPAPALPAPSASPLPDWTVRWKTPVECYFPAGPDRSVCERWLQARGRSAVSP